MGLGDATERALEAVGVTPERVQRWLGRPCDCDKRKQKLNTLGYWAARVLRGKMAGAAKGLDELME